MDTEALVAYTYTHRQRGIGEDYLTTRTWLNLVEKRDVAVVLRPSPTRGNMRDYVQVLDMRQLMVERRKLMEVRRKEAESADLRSDVSEKNLNVTENILTGTTYSEMAQASPKPSYVDVPRPSSSMMTKEFCVADLRIVAVSSISAMNVDTPFS